MNDMNDARKLASTVAKQSHGISVKIGETNGKPVLHLVNRNMASKYASRNVTSESEWAEHPWNVQNNKKKEKDNDE